jgi:surfactin synthase thioesterase subunit
VTGAPAVVLACLVPPAAAGTAGRTRQWASRLRPQVRVRPVPATATPTDLADLAGWAAGRPGIPPLALLGGGELGLAAFELAGRLSTAGAAPVQLFVCDCLPPPARPAGPLPCRITALAGPEHAERMAGWQSATTGGFTLRLLGMTGPPPAHPPSAQVVLALKEELAVWPY